ncbi:MAG: hypothetical protein K8S16_06950 [Bacteroidales bacterium]|nr:hypothetical protein [Bacteroidales bacterium]
MGLERLRSSQASNDISKAFFNLSGFLTRRLALNLKGFGDDKPFKSK